MNQRKAKNSSDEIWDSDSEPPEEKVELSD